MVMLKSRTPVTTYEVLNDRGESIGRVILPLDPRVVGVGQPTVFLERTMHTPQLVS